MNPAAPNPKGPRDDDAREERLGELINEFLDRRRSGENLSEIAFLSEHPEEAEDLREHFDGLQLLAGLGSSSGLDTTLGLAPVGRHPAPGSSTNLDTPLPKIPGYEVQKQIGRGGMGIVYKATQISTKRQVALKLLMEGPYATDQARKRFEREIALAAQLRHSNIIPIYDSGTFDGRMYYAMEYVRGHSLIDFLRAHRLDIPAKLRLFVKVCAPVQYAHQRGVVHRDMKPSNVLVDADGEPHVLDFGLAKAASYGDMSQSITAQLLGTPAYMSPEQASGDSDSIDIRSDIYSLGIVFYEILTGVLPYETNVGMGRILDNIAHAEPTQPSKFDKRISGELSAIVLKALEKNKFDRYQSLDAFAADIQRYLAGEPISVRRTTAMYLMRKAVMKHRAFAIATVSILICAAAIGLVVRHLTTKLTKFETKVAQQDNETAAKEAEIVRLTTAKEQLEKSKQLAEQERDDQRANYERFLSQLPKELKVVADVAKTVTGGVASGEDVTALVPRLAAQGVTELAFSKNNASRPIAPTDKSASETAASLAQNQTKYELPPEALELLKSPEVVQLLKALVPHGIAQTQKTATSQPTSAGPAEASRPPTSQDSDRL